HDALPIHRRGRRGDGRRGGDAQDVALVADAVAGAAGGRAGVAVGIRAGRAGGHVREVAAPRLRVAGGRPGAGVGVVGAGLHHVVLVAPPVAVAAGGRAGVAVGVRAGRAVGHVREVAVPRLRVAGGRPGTGVGVVGAGLHHVVLVAAVGHAAPRGERAVAARRRAGVVVRVRARRAVGHRGVAAHPGALVAHVLGALDVVVAVRTERDGARLLPRRREVVVAPGVVLGRQVAGGLLDLVRRAVGASREDLDVELEGAEPGRNRLVGGDHDGAARREHHLVRRGADRVAGRPGHAAGGGDRRFSLVLDDHSL